MNRSWPIKTSVFILSTTLFVVCGVPVYAVPPSAQIIQQWQTAAAQGDAAAQFNLGLAFATGSGVPRNMAESVKWFLKSAEQGNAKAQCSMGVAYMKGDGVVKNVGTAVKWFRKAADHGNVVAQSSLGAAYVNGEGVAKDYQVAYGWLLLAEAGGDKGATKVLASLDRIASPVQKQAARAWAQSWKPQGK